MAQVNRKNSAVSTDRAACVAAARERIQAERARAWADYRRTMDQLDRAERALMHPIAERDVVWRVERRTA